jgi:hypothetical protein
MAEERITKIIAREAELRASRATFESHWQEIVEYMLPYSDSFLGSSNISGEKRMSKILDATSVEGIENLSAGLHALLTNPATKWFDLTVRSPELKKSKDVLGWMEDTRDRMLSVLNQSNWGIELDRVYLDIVGFGTSCMFIGDDPETTIYCSTRALNEVVIAENSRGMVDTVFRTFTYSARQIEQEWPGKGSEKVRKALAENDKNQDKPFMIIHVVQPRAKRNPKAKNTKNMAWESLYIEKDAKEILYEGGFQEFPYLVPRWRVRTSEMFGRSPGMVALPFQKVLNEITRTILKAAHKAADPAMAVAEEAFMAPIRMTPGAINYVRGNRVENAMAPISQDGDMRWAFQMIERIERRIQSAFMKEMLMFVQDQRMTATEVLKRVEQQMRLIGPVLGRLQADFLKPLIDRVFGIMIRANQLTAPPEELHDQDVDVEYVSPLAKAQKSGEADNIATYLTDAATLVQQVPDAIDVINTDEVLRVMGDSRGVPQNILRSDEEVKAMREARAQAQQAQQTTDNLISAAGAAPQLGKAIEPGSPMSYLTGLEGKEEGMA